MVDFTIEEACRVLDPPMTPRQLRDVIRTASLKPVGHRIAGRGSGQRGRPHATYDSAQIMQLHAALTPWLTNTVRLTRPDRTARMPLHPAR